ncbi:MAG: hypothetical protein IAF38_13235 [Bacteroidia bacterium]|nr:hypothetical protein [Bacteroidia bacterium]
MILLGLGVANAVAALLMTATKLIVNNDHTSDMGNVLIFSNFVVIPLLMGIISAWFWRNLQMKNLQYFLCSLYNTLLGLTFSWIFMGEGYICLLIVTPLIWATILGGTYLGKAMFKKNNRTINAGVFGVLMVILTIDNFLTHDYQNMVSDVMVINAPPETVFKYVAAYERIEKEPDYWLFKIGMPCPVQSTVDAYEQGAGRKCIFSNGYVFDEVMTVYKPNEELTFEITHQPRDPEIMGHIDIQKGQFLLKDNGNGTTTLTGNSWYKLYVFPTAYYDLWAESITRNVHLRVMEQIKILSEKPDADAKLSLK